MSVSEVSGSGHHHRFGSIGKSSSTGTSASPYATSTAGSGSATGTAATTSASGTAAASPFVALMPDLMSIMMKAQSDGQGASASLASPQGSATGSASAVGVAPQAGGTAPGAAFASSSSGSVTADGSSASGSLSAGDMMQQMMKALQAYASQVAAGPQGSAGVSV